MEIQSKTSAQIAWDWPLTPALLCFIAGAVAFVVVLAMAGALP